MGPEINVENAVNEIMRDLDQLTAQESQLQGDLAHWSSVAGQIGKAVLRDAGAPAQSQPALLQAGHEPARDAAPPVASVCPVCQQAVVPGSRFCGHCGISLLEKPAPPPRPVCKQCGEPIKPNAKFCGKCGTVIKPAP